MIYNSKDFKSIEKEYEMKCAKLNLKWLNNDAIRHELYIKRNTIGTTEAEEQQIRAEEEYGDRIKNTLNDIVDLKSDVFLSLDRLKACLDDV
jgi:hypothetical protein